MDLPPDMLKSWESDGYIIIRGALNQTEINEIRVGIDAAYIQSSLEDPSIRQKAKVTLTQALERSSELQDLIDHSATLPLLLGLFGPYLQVLGSQIYIRRSRPHLRGKMLMGWHTDSGPALQMFTHVPGSPPLSVKVQYFLTNLDEDNMANLCVVPGSHRQRVPQDGFLTDATPRGQLPRYCHVPGALQLRVKAGDAVLFPHNLWHAIAPHNGGHERRSVTIRYGPLWCRPYDYDQISECLRKRLSPRQRRLLGDIGDGRTPTAYYKPEDQTDVIMGPAEEVN